MKVLVTGGTGFIGGHVVRMLLDEGREVRVMKQPGQPETNLRGLDVEVVEADLLNLSNPKALFENVDTIYHLAAIYAIWLPQRERMFQVNVEATVRFYLEAMKHAKLKKTVFTSSIAAVGVKPGLEEADESTLFCNWNESNDYVMSKYISELEVQRLILQEGLPATIVNPGFPFGAGDIGPTPTGELILSLLNGKLPFHLEGTLATADVEDVARGHLLAEAKGEIGQRHILVGHNITHKDFCAKVGQMAGVKYPTRSLPTGLLAATGAVMEAASNHLIRKKPMATKGAVTYGSLPIRCSNRKAREVLGLEITPLEESLRKAIVWFQANGYVKKPIALADPS